MNELQIFKNEEFGEVRSLKIGDEPWFVGKDVATILAYNEPHKAITRHIDEEDRMKHPILSNGGIQETWLINESGLYSLILSSKLP
ncbi:MAG: Bro-N domain-containing protein, partial [Thomasclavelia sp.]